MEERIRSFYKRQFAGIDDRLLDLLVQKSSIKEYKRKQKIVFYDDKLSDLLFLESGILANQYHQSEDEVVVEEIFKDVGYPMIPITEYNGFVVDSMVFALTECSFVAISGRDFFELMRKNPDMIEYYVQIVHARIMGQRDMKHMLMMTASDKVNWFLDKYQDYVEQIPVKYISSFLNLDRTTYTRIVNKRYNIKGTAKSE